jgi:GTP-binding protein
MFVDRVTIYVKGGDGGNGAMSFRREFKVAKGGPNGGDGGHGGNVILVAANNVDSLAALAGQKHWRAERGTNGMGADKSGRDGNSLVIYVPIGTIIKDVERGHILKDLSLDGDSLIAAHGGRGGHGNTHFKNSTNRAPREFETGFLGEDRQIALELKLIADVGLVGKPNAGKSTLLSRLSRAHPEIADYPFTTKYPNLGIVASGMEQQFVMADIPGLIEGAHAGLGLGHEFLKHVERTRVFVHLVEPDPMDQSDPIHNYVAIRDELRLYDESLLKRPEIIVVTKSELPGSAEIAEKLRAETNRPVYNISAVTGKGLPDLVRLLSLELEALREADRIAAVAAAAAAARAPVEPLAAADPA